MKAEIVDKDHGWASLLKRVKEGDRLSAKVGVVGEKGEEQRGPMNMAEIAAVNEFGTEDKTVPERSFLRSTFDQERGGLVELSRKLFGQFVDGKMTVERALGLMGASLAASVKKKMASGVPPPNAPYTLLRKAMTGKTARFFKPEKSNRSSLGRGLAQAGVLAAVKPLIDTGRLLGSITWVIVTGESE